MTKDKLEADRLRLIGRLDEANDKIKELEDKLIEIESLKNRYYHGHVQIMAVDSFFMPSKAMREISQETLYGEKEVI